MGRDGPLTGRVVDDAEVLGDADPAWSRIFDKREWPLGREAARSGRLCLFRARDVLVGPCFATVDLGRGCAFRNHFYEDGALLYPVGELLGGERYSYRPRPGPRLGGPVFVMGAPLQGNYFHWLLSWCARLAAARLLAPAVMADPALRFLVDRSAAVPPYSRHLLALGVAPERTVWADPDQDYRLEHALLCTLPSQNAFYPEVLQALAQALAPRPGAGPRRRIWIDRNRLAPPRRRIANMDQLAPVLDRFGLERLVLEDMDAGAQARAFRQAEVVAGVHGAGLANMIFAPPDARVLVVEKPFNVFLGLARTFTVLAQACGLEHAMLVGEEFAPPGVRYDDMIQSHAADVTLAPDLLADALTRLGVAPAN